MAVVEKAAYPCLWSNSSLISGRMILYSVVVVLVHTSRWWTNTELTLRYTLSSMNINVFYHSFVLRYHDKEVECGLCQLVYEHDEFESVSQLVESRLFA